MIKLMLLFIFGSFADCKIPERDQPNLLTSFKEFRNAIYQNNRAKAKEYFEFPILNPGNEIWYVAYKNNEKDLSKLPGEIRPFTEADFDRYFDNLFPKAFSNSLLKIKSADLFKNGSADTPEFKSGNNTSYKMYAEYDREKGTLSLNLAFKTIIKDPGGEVQDGGEFNIIYKFTTANQRLKFTEIKVAG